MKADPRAWGSPGGSLIRQARVAGKTQTKQKQTPLSPYPHLESSPTAGRESWVHEKRGVSDLFFFLMDAESAWNSVCVIKHSVLSFISFLKFGEFWAISPSNNLFDPSLFSSSGTPIMGWGEDRGRGVASAWLLQILSWVQAFRQSYFGLNVTIYEAFPWGRQGPQVCHLAAMTLRPIYLKYTMLLPARKYITHTKSRVT